MMIEIVLVVFFILGIGAATTIALILLAIALDRLMV